MEELPEVQLKLTKPKSHAALSAKLKFKEAQAIKSKTKCLKTWLLWAHRTNSAMRPSYVALNPLLH
jgi:hypothetical protein